MATKITRDIIESFLTCKYKGHLKLAGQQGNRSDYQLLSAASRDKVECRATDMILACHPEGAVERDVVLTPAVLKRGAAFLLNATLEDQHLSLAFDGLKRVPGPSKLGDFHYVPVLFFEGRQARKQQRTLLDVYGLLVSGLQGRLPAAGVIWHGEACRATRVRLSPDPRKAEHLLDELRQMQAMETPRRLVLNAHCTICEFRQRCHEQALQDDNISLLRGMKEKDVRRYTKKGIFTVTQLAHTFRPRRRGKRAQPKANEHHHALQALALRDKKVYVLGTPQLPTSSVRIYLDVEGNPEDKRDYLVGLIVVAGDQEQHYSFWADSGDQEEDIFERFLAVVSQYDDFLIFCYGGYERTFLKRMRKRAKRKAAVDRVLKSLVNVLSIVYAHVYFPTYSNGLKEVGKCLGCSWSDPDASGIQSIVWRMHWENGHDDRWKQKLITYNLEDCAALKRVTEFVYAVAAIDSAAGTYPGVEGEPSVASVRELDRLVNDRRRPPMRFFHPDFEYISKCSHFDYQRQRVFVRTSKVLKTKKKRRLGHDNHKLRVSRHVEISSGTCPSCGGTAIIRWTRGRKVTGRRRVKRAYDLVFTPGAIKRRVIECRAPVHECETCGEIFMPERYNRLAKHFHGLMSWVTYLHVAHRTSFPALADMVKDFFGLTISASELHKFKSLMAQYYRQTYKKLLAKIVSGKLLHIDETVLKLKTGKVYVWVFTNLEEVVYMCRPTREGDFLKKLLKNFKGVLVSDFYAAYDSIDCPQQKCLIHLIRDMNEDLLNNPYDEELQLVTAPFGVLMREIIATIDQYGLKRSHLKKHERSVHRYFQSLATQVFRSGVAEALRERLLKCEAKLFTFLQYDGVPWNNNNAENAIKQFVYYRERATGVMNEDGINDYLVLLSIRQTCRYRGVSFLKFLRSGQRDIDVFDGRELPRGSAGIETYPKNFALYHFSRTPDKVEEKPDAAKEDIRPEST